MLIQPAFDDPFLLSGITRVDTSILPWPGASFSITPSASKDHVESSYELLASEIGVNRGNIVTVHQVHGTSVVVTDARVDVQADGLVTSTPGIVLGVKLADCCGVLLHDPRLRVVAAVHSGWRGTSLNIVEAAIKAMHKHAGSSPDDIRVWLSPCASGTHYEVGWDVYRVLSAYCKPDGSKWLLDNRAAITKQCLKAGIPAANIGGLDVCTMVDRHWHSYRRDGELSGRMLAFIGLRE
ncbi:MAG: polyphenol oxidase family protein [Candidatus Kapabacteria bacterium]|nr:polyphenol oxidase family protein [Candidatus Kapabacteria bacterium]